jgi:hypothetical protein
LLVDIGVVVVFGGESSKDVLYALLGEETARKLVRGDGYDTVCPPPGPGTAPAGIGAAPCGAIVSTGAQAFLARPVGGDELPAM